MGPHFPVLSGREVQRALKKAGFDHVSTRGDHAKLRKGVRVAIVPMHEELKRGILKSILSQTGLRWEEFRSLL